MENINYTKISTNNFEKKITEVSSWCYIFLLYMIFVGVTPFSSNGSTVDALSGNLYRQLAYVIIFVTTVSIYCKHNSFNILKPIPYYLLPIFLWMSLSCIWSLAPDLTIRRSALVIMVSFSLLLWLEMLGTQKALLILRNFLGVVIVIDIASIPLIESASHYYFGDMAWAGMHGHKNSAGAIATLASLVFLHFFIIRKSAHDAFLLGLSIIFLYGTMSKTAMLLQVVSSVCYIVCSLSERNGIWRKFLITSSLASISIFGIFSYVRYDDLIYLIQDPTFLTDRGTIWQVVFLYAQDNFWIGSGFGAFWEGVNSPVNHLTHVGSFAQDVTHAHNSYLDVQASLGIIGVILSITSFIIVPFYLLFRFKCISDVRPLAFSVLVFITIGNVTKSQFLDRDSAEWMFLLFSIYLASKVDDVSEFSIRKTSARHRFFPSKVDGIKLV